MVNSYEGVNYFNYTTTSDGGSVTNFIPGVECDNTVDGNKTSATDVNGNIVRGCGNVISNITNGTAPVKVRIHGFGNVVALDGVAPLFPLLAGGHTTQE